MNNNVTKDNILFLLEDALQKHDWFYHLSDSPSPHRQGKAEHNHILYLISLADSFGLSNEAKAMRAEYYNKNYLQKISPLANLCKKRD